MFGRYEDLFLQKNSKLTFLGEQIDSKIYQIHMYVNETKREDNCLNTMTFYICFIHLYCGITIIHGGLMFVSFVGIYLAHENVCTITCSTVIKLFRLHYQRYYVRPHEPEKKLLITTNIDPYE